jgi:saposin
VDSNPICDDCKDWVKQARDLLEKKETAAEIIKALEWSCSFCPAENGRAKCKEIIADNVNELLKMLESQMDPDAVCSAIHLCNNREFTKMFENAYELESQQQFKQQSRQNLLPFTCGQCNRIGSVIENKLASANHDDLLEGVLKVCGKLSSFSDSCSSVVFKNFNDIYKQLPKMITREKLCQASCAQHYRNHEGIVDISPAFDSPAIPCELCEQLMLHLREVLIANTTAIEFKNILEGFCSQMPTIADECVSLAEQYYDTIYSYLVNGLDANKTCVMIGICSHKVDDSFRAPSMPLLSSELFPAPVQSIEVHTVNKDALDSIRLYKDGKVCTACEYTMNLVHIELNKHGIQDNILQRVRGECKKLPVYIRQCEDLIDMFGDQIMNAIYQGTNPRLVCPLIKMCPPNMNFEFLQETAVQEKPTCPFCLFAMQEVRDIVSSNTTKANVENVLDQLCTHLPSNLKSQCVEFVKDYSSEVVDMILANFTPQEACVFIKLCSQEVPKLKRFSLVGISIESESDESSKGEAHIRELAIKYFISVFFI